MISSNTTEGVVHIDTENTEVKNIKINKKECMLIVKNNVIRVYCTNS